MKSFSKLIDDYLLGALSEDDVKAFEKEMVTNNMLQREVKLRRELKDSINEDDIFALREKLQKSHSNYRQEIKNKRFQLVSLITAASILLLIGIRILTPDGVPEYEQLFEEHFKPYQMVGVNRDGSESNSIIGMEEVVRLYANREFSQVVSTLETHVTIYPNDLEANLLLSSAYLETKKAVNAEAMLTKIKLNPNDIAYHESIQWYLALSLLQQGKIKEVKHILKGIAMGGEFYSIKAQSILASLDE